MKAEQDEFRFGLKQRLYNWSLRNAREAKGWTQKELASMCGLHCATIGHYENLRDFPQPERAHKIAEALERPVEVLFPVWVEEFRLERVPRSSDDERISWEEIPLHALPKRYLLANTDEMAEAERSVDVSMLREQLLTQIQKLNPRERKVIELRFGLDDGCSRTLENVGLEMGVHRERCRQIEAKALRKLRHPSMSRSLKGYLE